MAERGAVPTVPAGRRRALRLVQSFTSPLLPDDYLELINPLWSTREVRGRIVRVVRETNEAATVWIKPGWEWQGHQPGQYLRLGIAVDGIHHWRAYSLTSEPHRTDGLISITPKLVPGGKVSPFLCDRVPIGTIVRLGGVEGTFVLPAERSREPLLFITAGSGITPVISMLRGLQASAGIENVVHIHCARTAQAVIFARELKEMQQAHPGYRLHVRATAEQGRVTPAQLDSLCPDWRAREAYACGPAGLLETLAEHWRTDGEPERLHIERFQPDEHVGGGERGAGGSVRFCASDVVGESDGEQPILKAGELAGAKLPHGCRMGICHTCVGRLRSGKVRDLRTGVVHGQPGEMLRTCVNAPEGAIEIDL